MRLISDSEFSYINFQFPSNFKLNLCSQMRRYDFTYGTSKTNKRFFDICSFIFLLEHLITVHMEHNLFIFSKWIYSQSHLMIPLARMKLR
jgi:hypothetical protein